ncbi:MAG TPA: lyase family protein, partial [Candidatus Dormibacteraeota bacterium]|nr:lyase family protein [Candidatus Dormibacteraeota bacterium]
KLADAFAAAATNAGSTPMPGYTHMQKAMPTTVAIWLSSFADGFTDSRKILAATLEVIDQNPLGSAAGFGVSVGIDRDHTTKTLGFARTQKNTMYCGLSRSLFELLAVQALTPLMVLAGKFAQDMLMFTTEEFGFFSLPDSFTTGSSIMPHKHNYDLFEVMRGNAHSFTSYTGQLQAISVGMGSGYQRDLQLTKGTTLHAFDIAKSTLEVLALAVSSLRIDEKRLKDAITPEMLSVTAINKLVEQGVPFRDAYNQVKLELHKLD